MHPSEPLPTSHPFHPAEPTDPLDRLARKRAGAKLGWYLHATLYVLVNVMLALLFRPTASTGPSFQPWARPSVWWRMAGRCLY